MSVLEKKFWEKERERKAQEMLRDHDFWEKISGMWAAKQRFSAERRRATLRNRYREHWRRKNLERQRRYYEENRDAFLEKQRKYRRRNRSGHVLT